MATPNRFTVMLGGVLVAHAWSLHAANEKLTAAVLVRASERGSFPVDGLVLNPQGIQVVSRHFPAFFSSDDEFDDDAMEDLGIKELLP